MFVLSLVKKHYRLQFYMVCISQVTLLLLLRSPPLTSLPILFPCCRLIIAHLSHPWLTELFAIKLLYLYVMPCSFQINTHTLILDKRRTSALASALFAFTCIALPFLSFVVTLMRHKLCPKVSFFS